MANERVTTVAAALLCLSLAAVPAHAKQRAHPRQQATSYSEQPAYQSFANSLSGTYISDAFFPSPLNLTITGMDQSGNLSGSISGWRSSYIGGEAGDSWERWQHVFGADGSRAFYRDGRITVVFPNNATYVLDVKGNMLEGNFVAGNDREPITFMRQGYGYGSSAAPR